jgi:hypothetical protein
MFYSRLLVRDKKTHASTKEIGRTCMAPGQMQSKTSHIIALNLDRRENQFEMTR